MNVMNTQFFRPRRLGHVNLWVSDINRSEKFYNEVCGLAVEFTEPGLIASFLGTGHTPHDLGMIEKTDGKARYGKDGLLQLPPGIGLAPGLNHIAWELENEKDLVDAYRRLHDQGIKANLTVDHQVAHSVYMIDPDGNETEYYCDTVKDWRNVLQGEMDLITSMWDPLTAEGFTDGRYDENPELRVVEQAPVHPRRLTHAVLVSPDPDRLAQFYRTVGGLNEVGRPLDGAAILLAGSHPGYRFNLAIVKADRTGFHHGAFELADEAALEAAEKALGERGIAIAKRVDVPWKRSFFLADPDGLLSEYYVLRGAEWGKVSAGHSAADLV